MKKFIFKSTIFIIPLIGLLFGDIFLSIDTYTYRPWEALLFKTNKEMFFYPNKKLENKAVGDLCHHTQYAIKKNENWITDKLGYRNDTFIKKSDVLIIGDSFTVGTGIPQDSTISNLLQKKLDKHVYNLAPAEFEDFLVLLNQEIIEKPKTVIYSLVERRLPLSLKTPSKDGFENDVSSFTVFKDKVNRLYSLQYLKSRVNGKQGRGVQGIDSTMFFLNGKKQDYHYDKITDIVKTIQSYKTYCDSIAIDFIFLPLPNKETVYFDKVPLQVQPDYLIQLNSMLLKNKIKTINTLELFNHYRASNSSVIYQLDDTHWNGRGVDLVSEKIAKYITDNTQN